MKTHALTIDVEDYFQVGAFEKNLLISQWDTFPPRVEQNTEKLLSLFDEFNVKATFFTLGWVAQRFPALIKKIHQEGHEMASHGMMHQRASRQSQKEFKQDVADSKQLLEDLIGEPILGYRAPSFSVTKENQWVYDILAEQGYRYSSSVYPVAHDHYGIPDAPRSRYTTPSGIDEIPLSTLPMFGKNVPISGGGYFRLYPYCLSQRLIKQFSKHNDFPYIFYLHPWEVDPEQPKISEASLKSRFRHYLNLTKTEGRLRRLIQDFEWSSMAQCYGYT